MEKGALEKLTEINAKSSLRYSIQLLSLAAQNAWATKRESVALEDMDRIDGLFTDIGEAAEHLRKYEEKPMHH